MCIRRPAVTFAFSGPLVAAYRYSVTHLTLINVLDGTTLTWNEQEGLIPRMNESAFSR